METLITIECNTIAAEKQKKATVCTENPTASAQIEVFHLDVSEKFIPTLNRKTAVLNFLDSFTEKSYLEALWSRI